MREKTKKKAMTTCTREIRADVDIVAKEGGGGGGGWGVGVGVKKSVLRDQRSSGLDRIMHIDVLPIIPNARAAPARLGRVGEITARGWDDG